ncbi:hypothetical protein GCM10022228_11230 [Halomonas cibimaris]|uniref:DUF7033 domain-containing protein n=1 Tax=Halomonas cibimaris TaxID=657012 RepID=A0ABP7LMY2_9GAMM
MPQFSNQALDWLSSILEERFGHAFTLTQSQNSLRLSLAISPQGYILFPRLETAFHQSRSDFPCGSWDAAAAGFTPVLGEPLPTPAMPHPPARLVEPTEHGDVTIHYDILGLTYWMLTRLEEVGRTDLDEHDRFPATSSHAYRHGYLERPIVDEWLDLLGQVIKRQWPEVKLKQHRFSMKVSHDVDRPTRYGYQPLKGLVRTMGGDILKRRDFKHALLAPWIRLNSKKHLHPKDPYNTFDWIMDQSEKHGLTSAFYFICGQTHPTKDALYNIEDEPIRHLIRRIHDRGHEVGLHPSYNTYQSPKLIAGEAKRLRAVCAEEGVEQDIWGGRMHYLRWETPTTLNAWNDAGMNYDSTLGYADRPGFRCGTCHEYSSFDALSQQPLSLRIRPLIVMECSVMAPQYLGLGASNAALDKFFQLKSKCHSARGCYTVLWHNSELYSSAIKKLYKNLL